MSRDRVFSGAPWEKRYGYCRAMRVGDWVLTTGTAPVADGGGVHAPGDAFAQATRCYDIIERALRELGAELRHVVRCRLFVTDISQADAFGRAHHARFAEHPPCMTMVEVRALIDPHMLVEIEVEAFVGSQRLKETPLASRLNLRAGRGATICTPPTRARGGPNLQCAQETPAARVLTVERRA